MNVYIIYALISSLFSFVLFLDNQISNNNLKFGFYIKNAIINFVILYFTNPFKFITGGDLYKDAPNFNTGINPFS